MCFDHKLTYLSQDPVRLRTEIVGSQTLKTTRLTGPGTLWEMRSSTVVCLLTTLYLVSNSPETILCIQVSYRYFIR